MKILLIGNGFDLEHHLPTTYRDFLSFCRKAGKIFTNFPRVSVQEFRENELKDWTTHPYIKEALDSAYRERKCDKTWSNNVWRDEVTTPYPELDELYANMKDNAWLNYFWKCPSYLGENWIDFESEISKVIQAMEGWRAQVEDGHSITGISLSERNLLAAIVDASDAEFEDLFEEDVMAVGRYSEYLLRELDRLTRALEIYLAGFVQKIEIDGKSPDIENLQPDHVLSFNYSNTYERVYGQGRKIVYNYIHGKAKLAGGVDTCDLVLGIDEYLDDDRKNMDLEFLTFKKYYQRIYKSTGNAYLDWVDQIKRDEAEYQRKVDLAYRGEADPLGSFPWAERRYLDPADIEHPEHTLYIFGHSLDVTDRDVLRLLICNDNVQTKIFYYRKSENDKSVLGKLIKNLVKIIGQDELVRRTGGSHKTIEFIPQTLIMRQQENEASQ